MSDWRFFRGSSVKVKSCNYYFRNFIIFSENFDFLEGQKILEFKVFMSKTQVIQVWDIRVDSFPAYDKEEISLRCFLILCFIQKTTKNFYKIIIAQQWKGFSSRIIRIPLATASSYYYILPRKLYITWRIGWERVYDSQISCVVP